MGCTSSREARYDRRRSFGSYHRSSSLPPHNPIRRCTGCGGGCHTVSLSSSTLGTLKLDSAVGSDEPMYKILNDKVVNGTGFDGEFSSDDITNAMNWSDMIEQKIPKTPIKTPPNEPETINVWELMEGLDDISPVRRHDNIDRSFSFHATLNDDSGDNGSNDDFDDCNGEKDDDGLIPMPRPKLDDGRSFKKSNRRRPMRLCYDEPTHSLVRERIQAFQDKINAKKAAAANARKKKMLEQTYKCPPGGEDKVVFYFTSLRGIRKTYEDCCDTLLILKGYGVRVDERDISMHSGFKEELVGILGPGFGGCKLPRVFAAGRYLGGVEEVREMDEAAKLGQALEGCERMSIGKGGEAVGPCELCDDMKFVPCETCSGSRKVYVDKEEEEEDADDDDGGGEIGEFRRCPHCNENGLVRCPVCCDR